MPPEPLRIGLLGAARIAPGALLQPAAERDDVTVVAVAARERARAEDFAREHGLEAEAGGYQGLIERDDLDLVYVALPPDCHCRWTVATLEAGKAVLCEKPFALDAGEARAMVEAGRRTGNQLIEGFHYRFHRLMRDALDLVRGDTLGEIVSAAAVVRYPIPMRSGEPRWTPELGGGAIMDLGCYGVHALRTLLGNEPEVVEARSRIERGVDAETEAVLSFAGVSASLSTAMDPQEPFTEIRIEGSQATLLINGFILPQRSGRLRLIRNGKTEELPIDGPSSYAAQLAHVVEVMRGAATPLTGGDDAIANMAAIDAIRNRAGLAAF